MAEELELPDEVYGFGSWLLWVLATRATAVVDRAFRGRPGPPVPALRMVDGHPVPTPSLVAWLLTAAESGVPLDQLMVRDARLDERQKVLRTVVSRAIGGEPRLFKDAWLRQLGSVCGLGEAELDLLARSRDDEGTRWTRRRCAPRSTGPCEPTPPAPGSAQARRPGRRLRRWPGGLPWLAGPRFRARRL